MTNNTYSESMYWFARGYYDGRHDGEYDDVQTKETHVKHFYKMGYDCGVTDYSVMDTDQ